MMKFINEDGLEVKRCSQCNKVLPLEMFSKNSQQKDGLSCHCKSCQKERDKERYQKNYPKNKERIKEKQLQYYYKNKEQRIKYQREYYQKNKKRIIQYVNEWQKRHPDIQKLKSERRKIRKAIYNYSKEQWDECLAFFNNKCAYSNEDYTTYDILNMGDSITVEHIIPLSKGGANVIWNIIPAKFKYNSAKGNKKLEDWYPKQDFFLEERIEKIYKWVEYAYDKWGSQEQAS